MNDKPISNLSQTQLRLINSHVETFDQVIKFLNHLADRSNSWTKSLLVSHLYWFSSNFQFSVSKVTEVAISLNHFWIFLSNVRVNKLYG